jgi:hypothetical protein
MPAGSDLYLDAFTRWILAGKSDGEPADQEQAARDKAHALGEMLDIAGVDTETEGRLGPRKRRAA